MPTQNSIMKQLSNKLVSALGYFPITKAEAE